MQNPVALLFRKSQAKKEYWDALVTALSDQKLDQTDRTNLEALQSRLNLSSGDIVNLHKKAAAREWQLIVGNNVISNDDKQNLEGVMNYLKVAPDATNFDQKTFNKLYTFWLISQGTIPTFQEHAIDIIFKPNEQLYWVCDAALRKHTKVIDRFQYAGPRASIHIMKGLNYRMGSYKVATISHDAVANEDTGKFWLTNQRFGFEGNKKNFVMPYNKILRFELTPDGLLIVKDGKETPYLVALDDYEVSAAILSHIMNSN